MHARFLIALLISATGLLGQRLSWSILDPPWGIATQWLNGGATYAFPLPSTFTGLTVSALQLHLTNGSRIEQHDVAIWDVDPVTNRPRNLLAAATLTAYGPTDGFFGAAFAQPVQLAPLTPYFVAITPGVGGVGLTVSGPQVTYYGRIGGSAWMPLGSIGAPSLRLYEGYHAGAAASFGSGKAGTQGYVPWLTHSGWPNTGNPLSIHVTEALPNAGCLFALGARSSMILPFGTLYVQPIVHALASTSGGQTGGAGIEIAIPPSGALAGLRLAVQAFVADPGAVAGLSHSQGIELVVGH